MPFDTIPNSLRAAIPVTVLAAAGCAGEPVQSALHPAGPAAAGIAWLTWAMVIVLTGVFVLVLGLIGIAVFNRSRHEQPTPPLGRTGFIAAGGVALPVVVLVPTLLISLDTSYKHRTPREGLTVQVTGRMWWWEVRYPAEGIVTANEIYIPAGEQVRLELTSTDVIHSFWVPRLAGKRDMIPGLTTHYWIQADGPGVYRGQCAEYCGTQHAKMAFEVVALSGVDYRAWVAERQRPRPAPAGPGPERGAAVFLRAGCANCHAVRGTPAVGTAGPDLTHVGSRRTLGAATLANTHGNLAGWVSDPQPHKPGVKMPPARLGPDDLLALTAYLETLR